MKKFLISKKLHSDIMCFQLQLMFFCEAVGKGVCITMMATGRNYSTNTIIQC